MKKTFLLGLIMVLAVTLALSGCGGGNSGNNGNGGNGNDNPITRYSDAANDFNLSHKYRLPDHSEPSWSGNDRTLTWLRLGNYLENIFGEDYMYSYRAFLSFDISGLSPNITSVKLAVYKYDNSQSNNLYSKLGSVFVDHFYYPDDAAGVSCYDGTYDTNRSTIGVLCSDNSLGWKEIDVTNEVKADILAGKTHSRFRLYHATEFAGDDSVNYETWYSGDSEINKPKLVVTP